MTRFQTPLALALFALAAPGTAAPRGEATPRAVVERFLADYAAERSEPMAAYIAPDAEMRVPFSPTGPALLRGAQATDYLRSVFEQYASIVLSDVIITPAADNRTVFVEARSTYTDRAGTAHDVGCVWAIEVVNGRIVRSRTYSIPS